MPQVRAAARPTTLGHYTLIERIGTGGQGEVWKAHDESRGVDIALKILAPAAARNPAAWTALEREHAISTRLQHPGILQILPPERCGDAVVLPMELAAGGDLRRLRGAGYLEIVPALLEAAEALEYAHARGVVHRDLKPGNVLLDSRGRVKLADFGIAALLAAAGGDAAGPSPAGHSPFSASPEQLRGEPPSPADDIYSLGALAYELLSGHPPYYPHFDQQRAQTQPVPELVPTRQIPPELGELVMRMLAKRAAQRPATMQQVMDELDATLNATLSFAPEGAQADEAAGGQEPLEQPSGREAAGPSAAVPRPEIPPPAATPPAAAPSAHGAERMAPAPPRLPADKPRNIAQPVRPSASAQPAAGLDSPSRPPRTEPAAAQFKPRPVRPEAVPAVAGTAPTRSPAGIHPAARPEIPLQRPHPVPPPLSTAAAPPLEALPPGDPFDLGVSEPRLRAIPPPSRRPASARAGGRRARHWPYLVSGLLCGAMLICAATAAALFWLPRSDLAGLQPLLASFAPTASLRAATSPQPVTAKPAAVPAPAAAAPKAQPDPAALARFNSEHAAFEKRAAELEARGAAAWDWSDFSAAQMQAAESSGAAAAGGIPLAMQHLDRANQLLAGIATKQPRALTAALKAGAAALAAGQQAQASQAFALARRIDPNSRRAIDGARQARLLTGVLPLLADARRAESAQNYSRAAQDFSQALALDPGNAAAKSGLARANAAFGDDGYARAVGAGYAALGAGRLADAQTDFQQAIGFRSNGTEAAQGLQRVRAAMQAGRMASLRQQAASLEAREHWQQAAAVYQKMLSENPSLGFAKRAEARDEERAQLSASLQQIIDHPHRLALQSVRDEAVALLQEAREQTPAGPLLQSQAEQVTRLLPELDRPVLLNLISDDVTQVSIPSIGVFGAFGRRQIRLKPGTYTVIGTRDGYRAVEQEFTVEPGQQSVTITVSCREQI
ncbi:MAG TPA: protein kinase [Steroidobacteraceae bacterium]|nr:protein kinase [Steroidobacteraceae bacterium]